MTKDNLFSLIKNDYNNALEQILDKKDFSEDVKNLLLSMLYKIENSYDDYEKIKVNSENQSKYIKELLNTINNCKKIVIAKPGSVEDDMLKNENSLYVVDRQSAEIFVYQNEEIMLKALQYMSFSELDLKEKYVFYKKALETFFEKGFVDNKVEVIRDFNGWSWDKNTKQIENLGYNLLYQNMLIILKNDFVEYLFNNKEKIDSMPNNEILRSKYSEEKSYIEDNKRDFIEEIKNDLEKNYGLELKNETTENFKKAIIAIICNIDKQEKKKIQKIREENNILYENMQEKEEFLNEQTKKKRVLSSKIKEIDNIINDSKSLKENYENYNKNLANKDKIFSPSKYANILIMERREALNEINKINKIMKPMEFVKLNEELKSKKDFFDSLITDDQNVNEAIFIESMQKTFLKLLNEKVKKAESKNEILDLIYDLRYYEMLPYENKKIYEIQALKESIENVEKKLIKKACDRKFLVKFSEDEELNYQILRNIFVSKIITLEEIIMILKYNKDVLSVELYDGDIIENTVNIKIKEKTELSVKLKKKIKVFI